MGEAAEERELVAGGFPMEVRNPSPCTPELPGQKQLLQQSSGLWSLPRFGKQGWKEKAESPLRA